MLCMDSLPQNKKKYTIIKIPRFFLVFKTHKKSVEVMIIKPGFVPDGSGADNRNEIDSFSRKSKKRMRLVLEDTEGLWKTWFIFTYPKIFSKDGRKLKRDIDVMNHWLRRKGIKDYFWGKEFQKRGAPHVNFLLPCELDVREVRKAWYKIVGSEDPKHLKNGVKVRRISDKAKLAGYILGDLRKQGQKEVPEGYENIGRFWGCSRALNSIGEYSYCFDSERALNASILPVVEYYKEKLNQWSKGKEKPYELKYPGSSFVMWDGSEFVNDLIEKGVFKNEV